MKAAEFHYHRPDTVDDATELLARYGEDSKILAGGQSLLPIMNMRLATPDHLIDITGIPELRRTSEDDVGARYGATTTHMMIEDGLVPDVTGGLLRTAAGGIGYRAIRTRGTLAGSLGHADSSAEWPTVLAALDARVHACGSQGLRTIPVRDLLRGFLTTALEPDEIITDVEVPRLPPDAWGFHKSARKQGEFAESLAVALRSPAGLQLWLGAARDVPLRLAETERFVADTPVGPAVDDLVAPIAADTGTDLAGCDPIRRHALQLHAATARRALLAMEGVTTGV